MKLRKFQTHLKILLEIAIMENIVLLITKSWNQLLDFIHNNSLWCKWKIIMQIMKFLRILQINLKNATFPS